ncbi:MAG: DoxX family protein [Chitinophagaceae bacterium]
MADANTAQEWKHKEKIIFRFVFIFFLLQVIPLDWKYYQRVFDVQLSQLHYSDFFNIARYTPQFTGGRAANALSWGLSTWKDWVLIALLSTAGTIIWSTRDKRATAYNNLYYLLRVLLRYRLAIAVIAYGFIKLFPMQQPYPSLSLLNTNYGDLSDWKIASLSYGVAPSFESFLGAVEVLAGVLLFFRKTASVGAAIVTGFVGNVLLSNLAYGGGEAWYCLYLLSIAAVLVWYDAPRWQQVITQGQPAYPNRYRPLFYTGLVKNARFIFKTAFVLVFALYGVAAYVLFLDGAYQYPQGAGLEKAAGLYNVSEFRINGKTIPYSLTDAVRWQNVVFEKWNTVSIATSNLVKPDLQHTEEIFAADENRNYEATGSSGRWFYRYTIDPARHVLALRNRNVHYAADVLELSYSRPDNEHIILTGINAHKDSIYVQLDRLKKIYLLNESVEIPRHRTGFE